MHATQIVHCGTIDGMRCAFALLAVLGGLSSLAGCERAAAPEPLVQDGRLEWRGASPCADCDGIDTVLVLQQQDGTRSYRLAETYLVAGGGQRFVEDGQWQAESALIRMRGDGGSQRVYAMLPDGRLQARDGDGRRLSRGGGPALEPVVARSERP